MKRLFYIFSFIFALFCWTLAVFYFSPDHFLYQALFFGAALLLLLTTYFTPNIGFYAFLALIPLANIPARFFELGAHEGLLFISFAFVLGFWLNCLVTRAGNYLPNKISVPLFLIAICCVSSTFWTVLRYADFYPFLTDVFKDQSVNLLNWKASFAVQRTFLSSLRFLVFPGVFWAAFSIFAKYKHQSDHSTFLLKIINIWACALVPVIAIALYQYLFDNSFCLLVDTAWVKAGRVSGGMTDPNALGLFLFLFVPLAVIAVFKYRGIPQMMMIIIALGATFVLTLSGSRSALLGLALTVFIVGITTFIYSLLQHQNKLRFVSGAVVAGLILFTTGVFFVNNSTVIAKSDNPLLKRLSAFADRSKSANGKSIFDRRELQWQQAISMWRDFPLTGIGIGAFPTELANYNRHATFETPIDNAWNQYLNWLSEFGVFGFLFWLWLYFACAKAIYFGIRQRHYNKMSDLVCLAMLLVFQVLFLFGSHLQSTEVSAGLAIVLSLVIVNSKAFSCEQKSLSFYRSLLVILIVMIVFGLQMRNAIGPLAPKTISEKYSLPQDYGFYNLESFHSEPDDIYYHWTKKNAGQIIQIPADKKVLKLKMAAMNPAVSPSNPQVIKVSMDNVVLDLLTITKPDWFEKEFFIFDVPKGQATLTIETLKTWQPTSEIPPRTLGIALATNICWANQLIRQNQGLSTVYDSASTNRAFRFTEINAALPVKVGAKGLVTFSMRAPAHIPFYKKPLKVSIFFNGELVKVVELPRNPALWLNQKIVLNKNLHNKSGILSFSVNRLTSVRFKGTVRKVKVGLALTNINSK